MNLKNLAMLLSICKILQLLSCRNSGEVREHEQERGSGLRTNHRKLVCTGLTAEFD